MFKYKTTKFILLILMLIISLLLIKFWNTEKLESEKMLSNNIKFEGVITKLNISKNHAFGIITLKILKANVKEFSPSIHNDIYPYAIRDSVAEIYHYVSPTLKIGMRVELDSEKKNIKFYDKDVFMYDSDIAIISEELDIKFVQDNSLIKW